MPTADVLCLSAIAAYLQSHHGNLGPTTQYNLNQPSHTRILLGTWDSERNMTELLNPWAHSWQFQQRKRVSHNELKLLMENKGPIHDCCLSFCHLMWLYFSAISDTRDEKHKTNCFNTLFRQFWCKHVYFGNQIKHYVFLITSQHHYSTSNVQRVTRQVRRNQNEQGSRKIPLCDRTFLSLTYHICSFGIKEWVIL